MSNPNKVDITIIVNGQPVQIELQLQAPLHVAAQKALNDSGNSGQSLQNWELRDANGQVLDTNKKGEDYGIAAGTKLFLNLKAGVGGGH